MARGYPDYFGTSLFPRMGIFTTYSSGAVICPNGVTTEIFDLTEKMVLFGGYIILGGPPLENLISVRHTIDGTVFPQFSLDDLAKIGAYQESVQTFYFLVRAQDAAYYVLGITKDIIVQSQFKMSVIQSTGAGQVVQAEIMYGKIVR